MIGKSILVVDDNAETLEMLSIMAKTMDFVEVVGASSAKEALGYIEKMERELELVVCDWNMPEQTGLDLLKLLRGAGNLLPFIMVTARNDVKSVLEARKHGVDLYISKPFSTEEFRKKVAWVRKNGAVNALKVVKFDDSRT